MGGSAKVFSSCPTRGLNRRLGKLDMTNSARGCQLPDHLAPSRSCVQAHCKRSLSEPRFAFFGNYTGGGGLFRELNFALTAAKDREAEKEPHPKEGRGLFL